MVQQFNRINTMPLTLKSLNQSSGNSGTAALKVAGDLFDRAFKRVGQGAEHILANDQAEYDQTIDDNTQQAIANLTGGSTVDIQRALQNAGPNVDTTALNIAGRGEIAVNDAELAKTTAATLLAKQKAGAATTAHQRGVEDIMLKASNTADAQTIQEGRDITAEGLKADATVAADALKSTQKIAADKLAQEKKVAEVQRVEQEKIYSARVSAHTGSFNKKSVEKQNKDWVDFFDKASANNLFTENSVGNLSGSALSSKIGDFQKKGVNISIPDGKGGYEKGKVSLTVSPQDVQVAMGGSINPDGTNIFSDA